MSKLRVAVDVGGTFTDVAIFDDDAQAMTVTKVPSTPHDPMLAVMDGVKRAEIDLSDVVLFSHGTTVATNALITRNFASAALVTTKGFRDVTEDRSDCGGLLRIHRRRPNNNTSQHPARAVNANKANGLRLTVFTLLCGNEQLRAELALLFLHGCVLCAQSLLQLLTHRVPETLRLGGRKRLQLQNRAVKVERHGHHPVGALVNIEAEPETLARHNLDAAEIHVRTHLRGFGGIVWAVLSAILRSRFCLFRRDLRCCVLG